MHILYYIDPQTGAVALQYGESLNCPLMQEFVNDEAIPSYETLSVKTSNGEYMTENALHDVGEHLFGKLLETVTGLFVEGKTGVAGGGAILADGFLHFPSGTTFQDVTAWLKREFDYDAPLRPANDERSVVSHAKITMLELQISELESAARTQQSRLTNVLTDLLVMLQDGDYEDAEATLNELLTE